MSWGQLALDCERMKQESADKPVTQKRDLAQVIPAMIAWQESGFDTSGLALPPVFAAVRLIASTIDQLGITVEGGPAPEWLRSPRRYGSALDAGDLIQWVISSMALHGSAHLRCIRVGDSWRLDAYHPGSVQLQTSTYGIVSRAWFVNGEEVPVVPPEMRQWEPGRAYLLPIPYLITPQHPGGISPITAARESLYGYFAVERQAATLLDKGTYSGGRLETDQDITPGTATRYQERWVENRQEGKLPVLGAGLHYVNDLINPRDAEWLESRQYNAQQICMMFGIPPDYLGMTASGGGSSLSYNNSQDNDRRYRRNCLEGFTSQVEDALSSLLPQGRGAGEAQRVRFDYAEWETASGTSSDSPPPAAPEAPPEPGGE